MASARHDRRRDASASGFVLIEALVSVTVFAVGIMAVLTAVLSALDLQKDSALRYRAGLILQDKLAETLLVPYSGEPLRGISADGLFSWTVTGEPWTGAPKANDQEQEEEEATARPSCQLFAVIVDVSWQTTRGPRSIAADQMVRVCAQVEVAP